MLQAAHLSPRQDCCRAARWPSAAATSTNDRTTRPSRQIHPPQPLLRVSSAPSCPDRIPLASLSARPGETKHAVALNTCHPITPDPSGLGRRRPGASSLPGLFERDHGYQLPPRRRHQYPPASSSLTQSIAGLNHIERRAHRETCCSSPAADLELQTARSSCSAPTRSWRPMPSSSPSRTRSRAQEQEVEQARASRSRLPSWPHLEYNPSPAKMRTTAHAAQLDSILASSWPQRRRNLTGRNQFARISTPGTIDDADPTTSSIYRNRSSPTVSQDITSTSRHTGAPHVPPHPETRTCINSISSGLSRSSPAIPNVSRSSKIFDPTRQVHRAGSFLSVPR